MKRQAFIISILMVVATLFAQAAAYSWPAEDEYKYNLAVKAARTGRVDFAYLHFRGLLQEFPTSKYRKEALFASGEYFYEIPEYNTARQYFEQFINSYPDAPEVLLALIFLFDITQKQGHDEEARKFKNEIVHLSNSKKEFQDTDTYQFISPLMRRYKVAFGGDRVLLFKNDTPFILITE